MPEVRSPPTSEGDKVGQGTPEEGMAVVDTEEEEVELTAKEGTGIREGMGVGVATEEEAEDIIEVLTCKNSMSLYYTNLMKSDAS